MPLPSPPEQRAAGRAARQRVSRSAHATFRPTPERADPLTILAAQDRDRVPELVPIRYGRMSANPFAAFRGQAAVMASDLATTPTTGLTTQLCGDAHLNNIGLFATPERRLVFDVNDFDETLPGPFEWDVKRLVASVMLAARHRGFDAPVGEEAVRSATDRYRQTLRDLARAGVMDAWYASVPAEQVLATLEERVAADPDDRHARRLAEGTQRLVEKAQRRTSAHAAERLTEVADGRVRFREEPPILTRAPLPADRRELATGLLSRYRRTLPPYRRALLDRFEVVDVARRVVGVGSVGTRAYVVLLHGRDADDPLLLQVKEALPSVLEAHLGASERRPPGRRVVEGQRLMQAATDLFLGWFDGVGPDGVTRHFYVRQFRDMKGSVDLDTIRSANLVTYAGLCGRLLAHGHASASGQPAMIAGYLGTNDLFADAMVAFAKVYADLAERDHEQLVAAIRAGRLAAEPGVGRLWPRGRGKGSPAAAVRVRQTHPMDRNARADLPYDADDVAEATVRLRTIAADLPEVSERLSHGAVTFFVRSKRTVCYLTDDHHGDGRLALVYPAPPGAQEELVRSEPNRFFRPPYVGHRGWVGLRLDVDPDWDEVADIVVAAYRQVAPATLVRQLEG